MIVLIIILWIVVIFGWIAFGVAKSHSLDVISALQGTSLLDIDSAQGAKYIESGNTWEIISIVLLLVAVFFTLVALSVTFSKISSCTLAKKDKRERTIGIEGIQGQLAGANITLSPAEKLFIGRDAVKCQLVLNNQRISRSHCSIQYDMAKRRYVVTCYSRNGMEYAKDSLTNGTIGTISERQVMLLPSNVYLIFAKGAEIFRLL